MNDKAKIIPFQKPEKPLESIIAPHHEEVEAATLAACLLDPSCLVEVVAAGVDDDSFYFERHQKIWRAISSLWKEGKLVDPFAVVDKLGLSRAENRVAWEEAYQYLAKIQDSLPSTSYVRSIIDRLHAYKVKRTLFYHSMQTINEVVRTEENVDNLVDGYQGRALSVDAAIRRDEKSLDRMLKEEIIYIDSYGDRPIKEFETGLSDIDERIAIESPGLIIVAGRPSSGKTALALNIMLNEAEKNVASIVYSIDNSEKQIRRRFVSIAGGPPITRLVKPNTLTDSDKEQALLAAKRVEASSPNILVNFSPVIGPAQIWASLSIAVKRNPALRFFVIDYLQQAHPLERGRNVTREREVASIISACKEIAKKLGLIAVVLSQLRKLDPTRKGKRPELSDLRDTGQIEQDADVVILLDRKDHRTVEANIAKNKDGETSILDLHFDAPHLRFSCLEYSDTTDNARDELSNSTFGDDND